MPERKSVNIDVGPLHTRGDLVKAPDGTSGHAKNCVLRRGVVEKRPGFSSDTTNLDRLYELNGSSATYLIGSTYGTAESDAMLRAANGTWSSIGNANARVDAVEYDTRLYMLGAEFTAPARIGRIDSFDGTSVTEQVTVTAIGGKAITSFIGRLIVGSPKFYYENGGSFLFSFNAAGEWTIGGGWSQPTGTDVRIATIVNGATDTLTTTAAAYTTDSVNAEYVTLAVEIQAVSATVSTPIQISLQNSTGSVVYGSKAYVVSNATDDPEWRKYYVTAYCPANTAIYAKIAMGNATGNATAGVQLRLSDTTTNHGTAVYPGHFVYPYGAQNTVSANDGVSFQNRIYFSEAIDFTDWRTENYFEVDEAPGDITALGAVNDRLIVYKLNGIWVYRPTNSALSPFTRESFIPRIGCIGPAALVAFENIHFFVGEREVYAFDGTGTPKPLCGEAMRDTVFASQVSTASIAVDSDNRELWVSVGDGRAYIYSIESQGWIGWYEYLADSDSLTYGSPLSLLYTKPRGESNREMWATWEKTTVSTSIITPDVVKLRDTTTTDPSSADIVAEYVFHAIESPRWRKQMTVQSMGIDHKVTGTQAAAVTEYSVSVDGGSTWSKYNQVRLPVSSGGAGDTDPIRVPLHVTAPRLLVKIKHTGPGGPTYFNMTGAELVLMMRGKEIQGANPTQVDSSL